MFSILVCCWKNLSKYMFSICSSVRKILWTESRPMRTISPCVVLGLELGNMLSGLCPIPLLSNKFPNDLEITSDIHYFVQQFTNITRPIFKDEVYIFIDVWQKNTWKHSLGILCENASDRSPEALATLRRWQIKVSLHVVQFRRKWMNSRN